MAHAATSFLSDLSMPSECSQGFSQWCSLECSQGCSRECFLGFSLECSRECAQIHSCNDNYLHWYCWLRVTFVTPLHQWVEWKLKRFGGSLLAHYNVKSELKKKSGRLTPSVTMPLIILSASSRKASIGSLLATQCVWKHKYANIQGKNCETCIISSEGIQSQASSMLSSRQLEKT